MNDQDFAFVPAAYDRIREQTAALQFNMASDQSTGSLLQALVASKPAGRFLELGTGTGMATSWILAGMSGAAGLLSIESNKDFAEIAMANIQDPRVQFIVADAYEWISHYSGDGFDLVFADAMPGKYDLLDETLRLVKKGGFYIIDDMLPQANWPEGHDRKVARLVGELENHPDLVITKLNWSTGIIIAVKQ